jgi:hypothetical protein
MSTEIDAFFVFCEVEHAVTMSTDRRKRAAPKTQHAPDVPVDPQVRNAQAAGVLLISQAQESMIACQAARIIDDPPRTIISPEGVATAVATRMCLQMPQGSDVKQSVPTEVLEALVQQISDAALVTFNKGWVMWWRKRPLGVRQQQPTTSSSGMWGPSGIGGHVLWQCWVRRGWDSARTCCRICVDLWREEQFTRRVVSLAGRVVVVASGRSRR